VEIADITGKKHTVLTNEGTIDAAELARLKEEMLHGNGFIIAKGVVPPELCQTCCDDLLRRGPEARRTSNILKYNDAFSEVLVHTWDRLGVLMEAIMGPRCFLNGYISNNLPPGESHVGSPGGPGDAELTTRWSRGLHSDYPYHQGTAGHLEGREPFTVQTIWFMSELNHENGGTRILPSSALWRRTPRRPQGHTLEVLDEQVMAQQKGARVPVFNHRLGNVEPLTVVVCSDGRRQIRTRIHSCHRRTWRHACLYVDLSPLSRSLPPTPAPVLPPVFPPDACP
jgi:hypothetical protein